MKNILNIVGKTVIVVPFLCLLVYSIKELITVVILCLKSDYKNEYFMGLIILITLICMFVGGALILLSRCIK